MHFRMPPISELLPLRGLKPIEKELLTILKKYDMNIISNEFARKVLPTTMIESLDSLNFGNTVLHGLFQWKE